MLKKKKKQASFTVLLVKAINTQGPSKPLVSSLATRNKW